ncbi:MAG: hypothetical protein KBS74_08690 [Clostridiales bacterium]|nr:hypothetical protein [Candidatus Cacconaster stercorequi]
MEKFIPYDKLSKKKQREWNAKRRGTWGAMSPVTRKVESKKLYNRKKARKWSEDSSAVPFSFAFYGITAGAPAPAGR